RPAQVKIHRMAAAHTGAAHQDAAFMIRPLLTVDRPHTGGQFFAYIVVPAFLHLDPRALRAVVVPAFRVDAVCCKDLQLALVDPWSRSIAHAVVLPIVETAALTGENDDRPSSVAVNLKFHHPVQIPA